jgi:hypothetical protein
MLAYDIVCPTYDVVCLFSGRRPAVAIILGPPPMLWAYGPNVLNSVRILYFGPVGLASGEQRWEIWFFCNSYPEKMATGARYTNP